MGTKADQPNESNEWPVEPGQVIAGKYQVTSRLKAGGMGFVVAARHLNLGTLVAIKVLRPDLSTKPDAALRFASEARAASRIQSLHVVRTIDVGTLDNGVPYIVMEYLRGHDLRERMEKSGRLLVVDALDYVLQACEGLAEAHAQGIVHRDLKPANLFLLFDSDGSACVKILDFGISKVDAPDPSGEIVRLTQTQAVLGTPQYMAPEVMDSAHHAGVASDIWAVGAILYELLTGKPPFEGESLAQICFRIAQSAPLPIRSFRTDVPDSLEEAVLRCLDKDPQRRWESVADLASALACFASAEGRRSALRIARIATAAGTWIPRPVQPGNSGLSRVGIRGRRALAIMALVAAGGVFATMQRPPAGETIRASAKGSSHPSVAWTDSTLDVEQVVDRSDQVPEASLPTGTTMGLDGRYHALPTPIRLAPNSPATTVSAPSVPQGSEPSSPSSSRSVPARGSSLPDLGGRE